MKSLILHTQGRGGRYLVVPVRAKSRNCTLFSDPPVTFLQGATEAVPSRFNLAKGTAFASPSSPQPQHLTAHGQFLPHQNHPRRQPLPPTEHSFYSSIHLGREWNRSLKILKS